MQGHAAVTAFETAGGYVARYDHNTRTDHRLRSMLQQQIPLGSSDFSLVPRIQIAHDWSSDPKQQRWKLQAKTPLNYALSDTLILLPVIPKLSSQLYTDRPGNRADWTMNVSAGIRWFLVPQINLRVVF